MSVEVAERIIRNISACLEDGDEITFTFQGGEPTLAGLSWFENFTTMVAHCLREKVVTVRYSFQTNGLLLDDSFCRFFRDHNFLVGLSLDGSPAFHDHNRVDSTGQGTYRKVLRSKELLEANNVEYNILCVLTNEIARDPDRIWRFILREKIGYIQFIPCLGEYGGTDSKNTLKSPRFASFYSRLFYWWDGEMETGHYISVKLFDDVANLFFKGNLSACGITGSCQAQFVVESDGSVYPCDFYALDEYNAGNLTEKTLRVIFDSPKMQSFLREKTPLSEICSICSYYRICGGGCKRMRNVMYCDVSGMCGFKAFLDKCLQPLENITRRVTVGRI
jgi:uncharacterized protein